MKTFEQFINESETFNDDQQKRLRSLGIASCEFDVKFTDVFEDDHDENQEAVNSWVGDDGAIVLSCTGEVDDIDAILHLELSNGDTVKFEVSYEQNPNTEDTLSLEINNSRERSFKKYKLKQKMDEDDRDEFRLELDEGVGMVIPSVLEIYKRYKLKSHN